MTTIGYIGLGAMGAPMLKRLAAGPFEAAYGFDADADTCARVCAEAGATPCASLAEIAAKSNILFSCLPNDAVIEAVYLGAGGVAEHTRAGTVTVDCSTVSPEATRRVHGRLAGGGVAHLDASMLGSVAQALEGTISFVVGGEGAALEIARPALDCVGGLIRHCGPSGAGNQMKLLHQVLVAGHAVAVGEVMAMADRLGADMDMFYDIVTQGTGFAYSRYFDKRVPRMRDGEFSALFMLQFMLKDARLARGMMPEGAALGALDAAIAALENGVAKGLGEDDFSAVARAIQDANSR